MKTQLFITCTAATSMLLAACQSNSTVDGNCASTSANPEIAQQETRSIEDIGLPISPSAARELNYRVGWLGNIGMQAVENDTGYARDIIITQNVICCFDPVRAILTIHDLTTGLPLWRKAMPSNNNIRYYTPYGHNGKIYINNQTTIFAFDAETGEPTAAPAELPFPVGTSATHSGRFAVYGSTTGNAFCYDLNTNLTHWTYRLPSPIRNTCSISGETALATDEDGNYAFINITNGQPYGRSHFWGGVKTKSASNTLAFYIASLDCTLYAINSTTAEDMWKYPDAQVPLVHAPFIAGRSVVLPVNDTNYVALNAFNGEENWKLEDLEATYAGLDSRSNLIFVDDTNVYTYSNRNGELLSTVEMPDVARVIPLDNGALLIVKTDGYMVELKPLS